MRLILYGTETDRDEFVCLLTALPERCYSKMQVIHYPDYDSFITGFGESPPDRIVIAMDGADGMEGVIAVKSVCKEIPVPWFLNDSGFGVQSYRLDCAYFHKKPVSPQIPLRQSLDACKGVTG